MDSNISATWMISSSSGKGSKSVAGLFQKPIEVPRAGFEPATNGDITRTISFLGLVPTPVSGSAEFSVFIFNS